MRRDDVHILEKTTPHAGYFRIDRYRLRHRRFDGGMSEEMVREVFERGHAVMVLPYDPGADRVVLIEQFRIGALAAGRDPWVVETVAGIIEEGETAEDVAHREALEEAGVALAELAPVASLLVSPGGTSETVTLYIGRTDSSRAGGVHGKKDEHEDIRVHVVPFAEALSWVESGRVGNVNAAVLLLWLALHRDELRARWASPA